MGEEKALDEIRSFVKKASPANWKELPQPEEGRPPNMEVTPAANTMLSGERMLFRKAGTKAKMFTLPTPTRHTTGSPSQRNRREIKCMHIGEVEMKLFPFTDNVTACQNSREPTHTFLELISEH